MPKFSRPDQFWGNVVRVIDGDTIEVLVQSTRGRNRYNYAGTERVRLRDRSEPELSTRAGRVAKERLARDLLRRRVQVDVAARDCFSRVLGTVQVMRWA